MIGACGTLDSRTHERGSDVPFSHQIRRAAPSRPLGTAVSIQRTVFVLPLEKKLVDRDFLAARSTGFYPYVPVRFEVKGSSCFFDEFGFLRVMTFVCH